MSDDSDQILHTLKMVGGAVLCTLNLMKSKGLLKPDSPVRNIAMVLARLNELNDIWPGGPGEAEPAWGEAAITVVKQDSVKFEGAPFGVEALAERSLDDLEMDDAEIDWYHFDWKKEFKTFKKMHSIDGGRNNDLTKGQSRGSGGRGHGRLAITLGPGETIEDFL